MTVMNLIMTAIIALVGVVVLILLMCLVKGAHAFAIRRGRDRLYNKKDK
jgi:hypothetical protein